MKWGQRVTRTLWRWLWKSALVFVVLSVGITLSLRWVNPPTSAFMLRAQFNTLLQSRDPAPGTAAVHYQWVDWDRISPHAALAVVAAEDQKFPDHRGFDFDAIADALRERQNGERLRGASTISQQVAKNLFLWPGRSLVRKGIEAYFTVLIETFWPKQRILEVYLNIAQFGEGVYGVGAASARYFRKPAARLYAAEAALLATVLPNPRTMRVARPSPYVQQRSNRIQRQMRALGGVSFLNALQ